MNRSFRWLLAMIAGVLPTTVAAQATPQPAAAAIPATAKHVLSVQPINIMLTLYAAEYERKIAPTRTLGVGATHWSTDDTDYTSADVKLRYYPNAKPFQGFSFGVQGGFTRITESVVSEFEGTEETTSNSGPSFGVALDYGWLLGATRSFYVGLGLGAKVVLIDDDGYTDDVLQRYPTARLSVGLAF